MASPSSSLMASPSMCTVANITTYDYHMHSKGYGICLL